jgi:hypothetical protein
MSAETVSGERPKVLPCLRSERLASRQITFGNWSGSCRLRFLQRRALWRSCLRLRLLHRRLAVFLHSLHQGWWYGLPLFWTGGTISSGVLSSPHLLHFLMSPRCLAGLPASSGSAGIPTRDTGPPRRGSRAAETVEKRLLAGRKARLHRGVAQSGRALRSGRRGRRFDPGHPDHRVRRHLPRGLASSLVV